jgi:hypothetical protein
LIGLSGGLEGQEKGEWKCEWGARMWPDVLLVVGGKMVEDSNVEPAWGESELMEKVFLP